MLPQKHWFQHLLAPRRAVTQTPFLLLYDTPQVTKYPPAQASHTQLTHRTDRPHLCNAFDLQLTVQHHRDSAFSYQGIESLLRLSPVSRQQPSIPLLLQHTKKTHLTIQRSVSRTLIRKMITITLLSQGLYI